MDQGLFISLLNPAIALVLALTFVVLWSFRRESRYILLVAASYAGVAIGFTLQSFEFGMGFEGSKFLSVTIFFASTSLFGSAIIIRQGLPIPVMSFMACFVATMPVFTWLLLVEPNLVARIVVVNYGIGAMCAVIWWRLRRSPSPSGAERVLIALSGLRALDFVLRPIAIMFVEGDPSIQGNLLASTHWLATSLSAIIFSIVIAITLMTMVANDVIAALRDEAHTDPLSGLFNRRGFEERARALLLPTASRSTPVALVLSDLDHFKVVNDIHGHAAGDEVIRAFARLLRRVDPAGGVIGRIGGEEFAILLPNCGLAGARLFAEGVRTGLAGPTGEGLPRVTASFGAASTMPGEDIASLIRRADKALYDAKKAGRDCVRLSDTAAADADGRFPAMPAFTSP